MLKYNIEIYENDRKRDLLPHLTLPSHLLLGEHGREDLKLIFLEIFVALP